MRTAHKDYFDALSRRNWVAWLWSGLMAAALNLALFLLMPHLVDPTPSRPSIGTMVPQVNVIRIQRPETQVRRPEVKPPEPPETNPVEQPQTPREPIHAKLTLPFEVNPRLPGGPSSLVLPPLESALPANAAALTGAFSVGQLDGPLTPLVRIPPVYPLSARRRGIEGWVKVAFIVDAEGKVGDIAILAAEPAGLFEESVTRCVRGWRFRPGTVAGMPVKAKVETVIRFALE